MNLLLLGIRQDMSAYLQRKIWLTNQVAVMCALIGLGYVFFIYAHYPALAIYPASLFIISCLVLVLNYVGLVQLGRFVNSFQMLTLATLFQASIIQAGEPFLVSFFCAQLAMTLIPWLLYDYKEKGLLIVSLGICYGLLVSQEWLNTQIEVPVDVTFFRESYLNPMTYASAAAIQITLILMFKTKKQPVLSKTSREPVSTKMVTQAVS